MQILHKPSSRLPCDCFASLIFFKAHLGAHRRHWTCRKLAIHTTTDRLSELSEDQQARLEQQDAIWFSRLKDFLLYLGTSEKYPSPFSEDVDIQKLGRWITNQRARKAKYLAQYPHRYAALESINFIWSCESPEHAWTRNFEALKSFMEEFGRVPSQVASEQEEVDLALWVQKQQRRRGFLRSNYPDRFKRLENIQFQWSFGTFDGIWNENLSAFREFMLNSDNNEQHPKSYSHNKSEMKLAMWSTWQRSHKRKLQEDHPQRYEALQVGVREGWWEWTRERTKSHGGRRKLDWLTMYQRAQKHMESNNGVLPNARSMNPTERQLAQWIYRQRRDRKSLRGEQVAMLDNTHWWSWEYKTQDAKWTAKLQQLEGFMKQSEGKWPDAHSENKDERTMCAWVLKQRIAKERLEERYPRRFEILDSKPWWRWDDHEASWQQSFKALNEFYEENQRPPKGSTGHSQKERSLAQWVLQQRHQKSILLEKRLDRYEQLDALPWWKWKEDRDAIWHGHYNAVQQHWKRHGRLPRPWAGTREERRLGKWRYKQNSSRAWLQQKHPDRYNLLLSSEWFECKA